VRSACATRGQPQPEPAHQEIRVTAHPHGARPCKHRVGPILSPSRGALSPRYPHVGRAGGLLPKCERFVIIEELLLRRQGLSCVLRSTNSRSPSHRMRRDANAVARLRAIRFLMNLTEGCSPHCPSKAWQRSSAQPSHDCGHCPSTGCPGLGRRGEFPPLSINQTRFSPRRSARYTRSFPSSCFPHRSPIITAWRHRIAGHTMTGHAGQPPIHPPRPQPLRRGKSAYPKQK
jgi:hypothetical protein